MSDLYRTTDKANMWDGQKLESMVRDGVLVKVDPTDRICIVHGTSGRIALAVLSDECHDHLHGGQNCVMVDVVRLET